MKWPVHEIDLLPPSRAEVENEWSFTATPSPSCLNGVKRKNLDFWFRCFWTVCKANFSTTFRARDAQRLPKRRQEIHLAHYAQTPKPKINIPSLFWRIGNYFWQLCCLRRIEVWHSRIIRWVWKDLNSVRGLFQDDKRSPGETRENTWQTSVTLVNIWPKF